MNEALATSARSFMARSQFVHSVRRFDATVDLEFGVQIRRSFVVDGVEAPVGEFMRERAKHCMVVLTGGKRLILRPDPRVRDQWQYLRDIPARVFLAERVVGKPIGYIDSMAEAGGPVLELTPYLKWLASEGFDIDLVREALTGAR